MSNAYLYVFTGKDFGREEVGEFLDTIENVDNWFFSMPNSVFIVGTVPARRMSKMLVEKFGQHRHFITLISKSARAGWMPKEHWLNLETAEKAAEKKAEKKSE